MRGKQRTKDIFWKLKSELVRLASEYTLIPYLDSPLEGRKLWVEVEGSKWGALL